MQSSGMRHLTGCQVLLFTFESAVKCPCLRHQKRPIHHHVEYVASVNAATGVLNTIPNGFTASSHVAPVALCLQICRSASPRSEEAPDASIAQHPVNLCTFAADLLTTPS
jgi:hypothetical protein